jgi:response regulator NasT
MAEQQNAAVLVVDLGGAGPGELEQALIRNGLDIVETLTGPRGLVKQVTECRPGLVVMNSRSLEPELIEPIRALNQYFPTPLILFAQQAESERIEEAVRAGAHACVVDSPDPARLRPIIDAARVRFQELQALHRELENTRARLADRQVIDRAKALLIQHRNMDEEEAYHAMRKLAMNKSRRLADVADDIIAALERNAPEEHRFGA